jgi:hypothetical protein
MCPFLPIGHRPSPDYKKVGSHTYPHSDSSTELLTRLQSFRYVQAPRFAHHPGRSYRSSTPAELGSRDFYFRAPHGSLPPRVPDILVVRIGQLTTGDLHPIRLAALSAAPVIHSLLPSLPLYWYLIYSLVSCRNYLSHTYAFSKK